MNANLTEYELHSYLPNFIPDVDPQIGDWVMISRSRQDSLLLPLIDLWETVSGDGKVQTCPQLPLSRYLAERPKNVPISSPDDYMLAPLSVTREIFNSRRKDKPARNGNPFLCSTTEGDSFLFLHVRLGLLTPSIPPYWGGSNTFEAILRVRGLGGDVVNDRFFKRTLVLKSNVPNIPFLEAENDPPLWLSEVIIRAGEEWSARCTH